MTRYNSLILLILMGASPLSATTMTVSQTGTATVGPFVYTFYMNASGYSNAIQGYITSPYGIGQTSQTVTTSASLTLNYSIPAGAIVTSAVLQEGLAGNTITDVYDSSNYGNNYPAHSYSSFSPQSVTANGYTESFNGSETVDSALLASIQAGNPLTLNSQAALHLYSNSNDWYCGYLFGGCNYTENTRTISDYFSETALLQINYTPDSAPTVSANALTVAGGTSASLTGSGSSALGYALTYAWVFSNGLTATGANPLINFASPAWASGLYTATLTATDPFGFSSSTSTQISVTPEPGTLALMGLAIIGLGCIKARRRLK
jgi:hypothetical protein